MPPDTELVTAGLPVAQMLLAILAVTVGSAIQGIIGSGFAFAVTPAMIFILPDAVPVTLLILALPIALLMSVRERSAIDVRGFVWITVGRVPGTFAGAAILLLAPAALLGALFGAAILAGVAMSLVSGGFVVRRTTQIIGGVASGVMGTAAGMGSPPLALVYQGKPGAELRSTLAVAFVIGIVLSLLVLAVFGEVEAWHFLFALGLSPGMLIGLWISGAATAYVDRGWLRPAVLIFASVSSIAAILDGLL